MPPWCLCSSNGLMHGRMCVQIFTWYCAIFDKRLGQWIYFDRSLSLLPCTIASVPHSLKQYIFAYLHLDIFERWFGSKEGKNLLWWSLNNEMPDYCWREVKVRIHIRTQTKEECSRKGDHDDRAFGCKHVEYVGLEEERGFELKSKLQLPLLSNKFSTSHKSSSLLTKITSQQKDSIANK